MQVFVDAQPQIVGNPLPNARCVVVVDIRRDRADDGYDECGGACK